MANAENVTVVCNYDTIWQVLPVEEVHTMYPSLKTAAIAVPSSLSLPC